MGSGGGNKACVNASCGATTTTSREWKRGWPLRSGDFALLCFSCGSAYENSVYCDTFHSEESGWRECSICNKRLHCGCIASESLLQLLDYGGVECSSCVRISRPNLIHSHEIPNGFGSLPTNNIGNLESLAVESRVTGNGTNDGKLVQLCRLMEASETIYPQAEVGESSADLGKISNEVGICLSNGSQPSAGSFKYPSLEKLKAILDAGETCGSLSQPSGGMTPGAPSFTKNFVPFASGALKVKEQGSPASSFQQAPKSRSVPPKPTKSGPSASSDSNKVSPPEPRIARPPAEGRGKNQLLPRYWPRITDEELQQLSGDLNSKIVPLFEKVLSASDAGRIGRLVLPKACAEAYFPTISQSEGRPIRVQDIKGREWTFQFRFWPNNNSRMYVLEGVTPCIQSMQLRAGDTIMFSRIDPGGRLVLGYRKATNNSADTQEDQASTILHGTPCGDVILPVDTDVGWNQTENQGVVGTNTNSLQLGQQLAANAEKKKARNIGPKSKRLLMHSEDAMELRLTWEEAQDLLRPPPNVKPTVIAIDDYEFEEYDEPPVFGKRTIFTTRPFGRQDQWAQCDECYKWRKLPVDSLLPAKWSCSENIWDSFRCSCSEEEEMNPKDMDNLLRLSRDFKRRRTSESRLRPSHDAEPSGLDALASAAVLGETMCDLGEPSVGATTKHPRHRPGCTCIVCIQPPSGKGKHKPTCTCNVCMTVKRRFKTLMLRKKKRPECESEVFRKVNPEDKVGPETNGTSSNEVMDANKPEIDGNQVRNHPELAETSPGQIDLNYFPNREERQPDAQGSNALTHPDFLISDNGSKLDELEISKSKQQGSMSPSILPHTTNGESLGQLSDHEAFLASIGWEQPNKR